MMDHLGGYSTERCTRFHRKGAQDSMGKVHKWSFLKPQDVYPKDKNGDFRFLSAFNLVKSVFLLDNEVSNFPPIHSHPFFSMIFPLIRCDGHWRLAGP